MEASLRDAKTKVSFYFSKGGALARTRSGDYLVVVGRDDKGLVALAQSTDPRVALTAPHCRRKLRSLVFKTLWERAPVIAFGRKLSRGEAMSSSSHPQRAGLEGRRSIASRLSRLSLLETRPKPIGARRFRLSLLVIPLLLVGLRIAVREVSRIERVLAAEGSRAARVIT